MKKTKFKQTEIGMIPKDWGIIKGEDCLILDIGSRPKGGVTDIGDIPSLGGEHIDLTSHRIDFQKSPKYVSKGYFNQMKNGKLKVNDILINKDGAYTGKLAFVWELFSSEIVINEHLFIIRNKGQLDQRFLFYYLFSNQGEYQIKQNITGSAQPGLNTQFIKKILLPKPDLSEQIKISEILSNLDLKINIIKNQNKILEAISRAIFKHWFIDFEFPNEKGKPYKSSGGEMVDSEMGEIPKGWKAGRLGELGKIQPGFAFKSKDFLDKGIGLAKIKNIQSPIVDFNFESYISEELYNKTNNRFYLSSGDILIAMTGAKIGKIGIIPKTENKILLNQRVGKVESDNKYLIYLILRTNEIQGFISGGSSASSAQGNISNSDIENFTYLIPDKTFLLKINNVINCLFNRIVDNLGEIQNLSQIRDSLLPRLMSGKIRVPVEVRK